MSRRLRLVALVLIILCSFLATPAAERWLSAAGGPEGAEASAVVTTAGARGSALELQVRVPGLFVDTRASKGGPRALLRVPGAGVAGAVGDPALPVLRTMIEIPPGAELGLELVPSGYTTLRLLDQGLADRLMPRQSPVPKLPGAEEGIPFIENVKAYSQDSFVPAAELYIVDRAVVRGRHIALVEIPLVRYNPAEGMVLVLQGASVRVSARGGSPESARRNHARLDSVALAPLAEQAIAGSLVPAAAPSYGGRADAGGAAEGAEGLVVVVHDAFEAAAQPLIDWKRKSGYKVEVIKTSSLGASPTDTDLKAALQTRYDSWSQPSLGFVLLIGDTDFTPIHNGSGGGKSQVTDNWFACLDGSDYLPDVAIARISTRSAQETTDVVDKLMTYEKATFSSTAWIKDSGFIGTKDSGHITLIEETHDWCIDNYFTPNGYRATPWSHGHASCDRHYNTTNATTADISSAVNAGRTIFNYSGHGGNYSWEGPTSNGAYEQSDVRANTNDGMYPFVISNACITGKLDRQECFGETWQKAPNKGAIAFLGASNNSYWDEDDLYQRQLHDHIFPMDTTPAISLINNRAKLDLYNHYGDVGNVRYYYDMYNMLSEPTLSLWTRAPRTLDVSYASQVPTGSTEFEVTVERAGAPVEGALVAIHKSDEGLRAAGYTDASGKIVLPLDPAPMNPGTMEVTVTGHDDRPHEGSTEVIPVDGPWLRFVDHTLSDAIGGCDADGIGDVGELVEISVRFENIGSEAALDAQATLSSLADIAVLVNPISLGTVAPGEFGTAVFEVKIGAGIGCEELVTFDVHTTCTGADGWNSSFSESFEVDHRTDVELEGFEAGGAEPPGWTHGSDVGGDDWAIVDSSAHGGAWAYHSSGVAPQKDIHLVSAPLEPKGEASVSFWHRYDLSPDISGAFLQLSADGGANWVDLTERISGHVYNHEAGLGVDRRRVWAGTSSAWVQSTVDLNPWSGQTVHLRFRIGVVGGSGTGWWIDDVELRSVFVGCDVSPCGVPESVRLESVTLDGEVTVLTWWDDPVAQSFSVLRSADPTSFDAFSDVSHLDDDVTDGRFRDTEAGTFACWLVRGTGPDGEGALDHYGH